MEEIHDHRIIPLDGRPRVGSNVRQWLGDSRGRWEGKTLVVETRNFNDRMLFRGATRDLRLVERFTRIDARHDHLPTDCHRPGDLHKIMDG